MEALDVGPAMENSVIAASNFKNFDDYILQQSMIRYLRQASKEGGIKRILYVRNFSSLRYRSK